MSQYRIGTADVTNGQMIVLGHGTAWLSQLAPNQLFSVSNENVWYEILSIQNDGQLTLASVYTGTTKTAVSYAVQRDFTPNQNYAIPSYGDTNVSSLLRSTLLNLDAFLATFSPLSSVLQGNMTLSGDLDITVEGAFTYGGISFSPGVANGLATLDGTGKVPLSQIPASVLGAMIYQGSWNATTNSPTLSSGAGTKGYYYKVSVAGSTTIDGISQWNVGDLIAFNGTTWDKFDGISSEVLSVAGRTGAVTLSASDVSGLVASATIDTTNAANITSGTISLSRLSGITNAQLAAGVAVANLGFTPANKAGDTFTGAISATQFNGSGAGLSNTTVPIASINATGTPDATKYLRGDGAWVTLSGSVTSVSLSLPAIFSVTGSPVTSSGTLSATLATQAANLVFAGPTTGAAASPSFRALVGADLPLPASSTLGGVKSATAAANQFQTGIDTTGAPTFAQPGFTNLSGSVQASQMPAHTGDVTSTAGAVVLTIASNVVTNAKMAQMAANTLKGNNTGSTANGADLTISQVISMLSALQSNATANITKGFTITPNNIGTISSGTVTPDPTLGNYQYMTNNGAFTLAAPTSDCAVDIIITNGASAGSITFSGYTVSALTGEALTLTNGNKFIISIRRINGTSTYLIKALQ
jgi:hypothetical protein